MDVYSGLQYAALKGYPAKFMTSKQYTILLPQIIPRKESIIVIESQNVPFTINLAGNLQRNGYNTETIYVSGGRATNLALAKQVGATRFIVVDPAYGYNAISVIPYAVMTGAYVLLADAKNIDQVVSFLSSAQVDNLILYGQLDNNLVRALGRMNPEVVDTGNRYTDNAEIIRRALAIAPSAQLLLTDGSIIEEELIRAGALGEVTLLIGKDAVPDDVVEFIRRSNFKTAVLVGNHLTQSAKRLKDATNIPVFVKFGQGITRGSEGEPVKALDMFPLPVVDLEMVLKKAQYNTLTKSIEITYENRGVRAFLKTSAGILADGERIMAVGDPELERIEPNETHGFQYPADLTEYIANQQSLTVDLFTLYGESPRTLDHAITLTAPLEVVTAKDDCKLSLKSLQYNARTARFLLTIENDGKVDCHADIELREVIIDDVPTDVPYPGIVGIPSGDTATLEIKQRMSEVDLADNPEVRVRVQYGERQDFLLSLLEARLPVKRYEGIRISSTAVMAGVIGVLLIIIIIMFFIMRRQRKGGPEAYTRRRESWR
jgi:hypothetical protein